MVTRSRRIAVGLALTALLSVGVGSVSAGRQWSECPPGTSLHAVASLETWSLPMRGMTDLNGDHMLCAAFLAGPDGQFFAINTIDNMSFGQ